MVITAAVGIFAVTAAAVLILILRGPAGLSPRDGAAVSSLPGDRPSSMASGVPGNSALAAENDYGSEAFRYSLKHPFGSNNEGLELTIEQLEENITDLEEKYQAYLKGCKSEYLKEQATGLYDEEKQRLQDLITIKKRTPEQQKEIHEGAFYHFYQRCKDEYIDHPERYGWSSEEGKKRMNVVDRAKRYYEEGVITIEQACQAVGLTSPSLPYDDTFSLPD